MTRPQDALARDGAAAQAALLAAANDVDKLHRIHTTPMRDVSPEDLAWYDADGPHRQLRRAVRYPAAVEPMLLPGIAEWLRALAGGRPE